MAANETNPTAFHHTYEESVYTRVNPEERVYDDTFDVQEKTAWGGRPWVPCLGGQQRNPYPVLSKMSGFTMLSYNVYADCKCQNVRYTISKKWSERCRTLIREIASYNADILCLQDVDHFADWWRPQLMLIGYDSVYKKRTQKREAHYEGVLVAYKRNGFQLFRSVALDLNRTKEINTSEMGAAFKDRLMTDDVALICMLQPWKVPAEKKPPMEFRDKFSQMKPVKNKLAKLRAKAAMRAEAMAKKMLEEDAARENAKQKKQEAAAARRAAAIRAAEGLGPEENVTGAEAEAEAEAAGNVGFPKLDMQEAKSAVMESKQEATVAAVEQKAVDPLDDFAAFDEEEDNSDPESDQESEEEADFDDTVQSALCVVSAQLSSREQDYNVRYFQAQYIMREVEACNKEFHLPVVLGVSLFDSPISSAYHVFKTGRSPIKPQSPRKCAPPRGVPFCRGSTVLNWRPPYTTKEDPPILSYKLAWRPGGSLTLGFRLQMEVDPVMCLAYEDRVDGNGVKKTVQLEDLRFVIPGLTSDIPFEFIVCAVNEIGEGIWSDPSMPVVMPNPERAPPMPALKVFRSTKQVREIREGATMGGEDWDVEVAISSNPINSRTQLTPRLVDGRRDRVVPAVRVLPLSINPREGWKKQLGGGYSEELSAELLDPRVLNKSILRKREEETDPGSFLPAIVDSPRGKRAFIPGMSTKQYLLATDTQNAFQTGLPGFDPNESVATDTTDASSINFMGTLSQRKYEKILSLMIDREKLMQTGMQSTLGEEEGSYMQMQDGDDEEVEDEVFGNNRNHPSEDTKQRTTNDTLHEQGMVEAKTQSRPPYFGPGETESKPYIETGMTQTMTAAYVTQTTDAFDENEHEDKLPQITPGKRTNASANTHGSRLTLIGMSRGQNAVPGNPSANRPGSPDSQLDAGDSDSVSLGTTKEPSYHTGTATREYNLAVQNDAWEESIKKAEQMKLEDMRIANLEGLRDISRNTSKLNDSTYLDGADLFQHLGTPHARTLHTLPMRSAYEQYGAGGEPLYTQSYPAEDGICGVACTDYIFYSGNAMYATEVLACPEISQLYGENPRELIAAPDAMLLKPKLVFANSFERHKQFVPQGGYGTNPVSATAAKNAAKTLLESLAKSYNAFDNKSIEAHKNSKESAYWAGVWAPFVGRNKHRTMHWLPNDVFTSSHIAIAAKIHFLEGNLTTNWR